jgi:hypothetical protein
MAGISFERYRMYRHDGEKWMRWVAVAFVFFTGVEFVRALSG